MTKEQRKTLETIQKRNKDLILLQGHKLIYDTELLDWEEITNEELTKRCNEIPSFM